MKKFIAGALACSMMFAVTANAAESLSSVKSYEIVKGDYAEIYNVASGYYNCIREVDQIKYFIRIGLYLEAIQVCEETLAWHPLSEADISLLNWLKSEAANRYNDYLNSIYITPERAIELIKDEEYKKYNGDVYKFKMRYTCYDKGDYYLVCATATAYADGADKYRVYKSGGRIEFIGSGSSWASDDAEYFM